MRLGVYGWMSGKLGGLHGGHYLVVKELLSRGYEVDFFTESADTPIEHPSFRLVTLPSRTVTKIGGLHPSGPLLHGLDVVTMSAASRHFRYLIEAEHRHRRYSAFAFMGMLPQWRVADLPILAWEQEAPGGEVEALQNVKDLVINLGGRWRYAFMRAYQAVSTRLRSRVYLYPDALLCGSTWSKDRFVKAGYRANSILTTPYPVDIDLFRPTSSAPASKSPLFVHLGRCDPRKRLDLLVAAFRLVRTELPDANLQMIGHPGYFPPILDLFEGEENVLYTPWQPHHEMVELLSSAHVLVQTSQNENFGSAVSEGLSSGLPVVVGVTNGSADYIDEHSVFFKRHEPDAVAMAMIQAWQDDTLERRHRRLEHARTVFAPATVTDTFERALTMAAHNHSAKLA